MDKARKLTDKKLNGMKREISRVYNTDPALRDIMSELQDHLNDVKEQTQDLYDDYINETDQATKVEKKKAYTDTVRKLTLKSSEYKKLVKRVITILTKTNQKAIDVSNDAMIDIYTINYNQVAEDCKKAGIKVNG